MPMRATKASHFPPSLADIQFKRSRCHAKARIGAHRRHRSHSMRVRGNAGFLANGRSGSATVPGQPRRMRARLKKLVDEGFLRQTADGRYRLPSQQ